MARGPEAVAVCGSDWTTVLTWLCAQAVGGAGEQPPVLAAPTLTPSNQLESRFTPGTPRTLRIMYFDRFDLKSLIKGLFIFALRKKIKLCTLILALVQESN